MIAMDRADHLGHLLGMEGPNTAAPEGNVNYLLVHWENFISQRVHIHSICEYN